MRRLLTTLLCLWTLLNAVHGQFFDDDFRDRTLRLDYVLAGDSARQLIFFDQAYTTTPWAGRRTRLTDMPLLGDGQLRLSDHATGRLLYTHTFSTLFQEWQATGEARRVARAFEVSFNVPLPKRPVDVTVTLTDFHRRVVGQITHTVDPADILIRPLTAPAGVSHRYVWPEAATAAGSTTADLAGRIDLAIVAEGYQEHELDKFYADCRRAAEALFAHEPFTSLKDRFSIVAVAAASQGSGTSVPRQRQWRSTPVATHYDTFYTERYLMTEQMHRLYDLLAGVPFEHVIVLVNSDLYGGGGIYNQLLVSTTGHSTFRQVLVHEFGHSYAGLADEYDYGNDPEPMYPADTEPWEPNLTTQVDFARKWADMLPDATGQVGLYEGGGYQSKGVWRPSRDCRMKTNEADRFCPVCDRAIRRITDFYTN